MYLGKGVRIFLKEQAKERFLDLKNGNDKESKSIFNSIERIKEVLKNNPQYGDPIKKELIPRELQQLGIGNLYRIELSNYWRMLYTLEGTETEISVFVLKILNHKEYNQLFGYKN